MKNSALALALLSLSLPAAAQNWSVGAGTGPFVWGHFVERTTRVANPDTAATQTVTLSAATRPGLSVDLERRLGDRFAVRLEGTLARAPLGIKGTSRQDSTVTLPAGDIDVLTLALPLVFRINPRGTFRFNLMAGPAAASYRIERRQNAAATIPIFTGTRTEWGVVAGAGLAWQWNDRFAVEAKVTDINTSSPFRREEIGGLGRIEIDRADNLHTTIGLRHRF